MSRKVDLFASVITNPLPIHNFLVNIPKFEFNAIVESTALPSEQFREVVLYSQGEEIRYPTIPANGHTWAIRIPENDDGKINRKFLEMKNSVYDQQYGLMTPQAWFDTEIYIRDLQGKPTLSTVLHGCWLKGRNDVNLSNNDPSVAFKWDFQFIYQWLEDKQIKK